MKEITRLRLKALRKFFADRRVDYIKYIFTNYSKAKRCLFFNFVIPFPENHFQRKMIYNQLFHFIADETDRYFNIKSPKVIIDCGASFGILALNYSRKYPNSLIYAFEPNPKAYMYASHLIKNNNINNIHLYNCAVSDKEAAVAFYVNNNNFGSSSLYLTKKNKRGDVYNVRIITLTNFIKENQIKNVDFLKVDVEGSEFEILGDLHENNMLRLIKNINIEIHLDLTGTREKKLSEIIYLLEKNAFYFKIHSAGSDENASRHLLWASKEPIIEIVT